MARKVTKRQALTTFSIRSSSSALNFALVGSPPGEMASGGAPLPNAPRSPPLMSPPPRAREEARRGGEHRWRDQRSRLWILRCRESSEPPLLEVVGARICGVALRLLRLDGVAPARCRRLARICGVAQRGPRLPRLACRRGPRPPRPQVASVVGLDAARRRAGERRRPAARQPRDEWRSLPLPQGAEAAAGNRSRRTEGIRRRQPILPRILVVRETRRRPSGSGKERRRLVEAAMQNARVIPRLRDEERATAFCGNGCSICWRSNSCLLICILQMQ
jgi:hypothetical protein